jgi:ribosomal protein S18 acetylase RimI-like enzyme
MTTEAPAFSIRPAKADDLNKLFIIHKAALGEYIAATWGWDDAWQFDFFREHCRPEVRSVIEVKGQSVGFIDLAERDGCIWLDNIEIDPEHQGNGIGSAIIKDLIARARATRVRLRLQVLKVNKRAEALYKRLGFRQIDETVTHLVMEHRAT